MASPAIPTGHTGSSRPESEAGHAVAAATPAAFAAPAEAAAPLFSALPAAQGLYDPRAEKDSCGVAFVATLTGVPSHAIVVQALQALVNMEHRGASGAEPSTGDGAGILVQVPDGWGTSRGAARWAAGTAGPRRSPCGRGA